MKKHHLSRKPLNLPTPLSIGRFLLPQQYKTKKNFKLKLATKKITVKLKELTL